MFISNGTARMPGFKYTYTPEQIAAIAAYIKTLPPGNQDIPTAPRAAQVTRSHRRKCHENFTNASAFAHLDRRCTLR